MTNNIWTDETGAFELPVQYTVAIVAAAVAVALVSIAGYHLWQDMQTKHAVREVERIVDMATMMYATADVGTARTIRVDFPAGMKKAGFGSSDTRSANRYYVVMDWGENNTFYARNTNFSSKTVLHDGVDRVRLRLIDEGGKHVCVENA
jgi:hypothetical protein